MPDSTEGFEAPDLEPTEADFEPFDPRDVSPSTSTGPAQDAPPASSETPSENLEPQEAEDIQAQAEEEPLPEFDPKWRDEFEGLIFIGALTRTFSYLGHQFIIRTLTVDEILEIGLLTKPYRGTLGDTKAYQAAVTAACVVSVDGNNLPIPITNEVSDTLLLNRFNYVKRHWFPPILDAIYEQYLVLENTVDSVLKSMQGSLGNSEG